MEISEAWMEGPESVPCILCGSPANRPRYGAHGWKYKCSGRCHHFAVPGNLHYLLELENVFPHKLRMKVSEYLVSLRLDPAVYSVLRKEDINLAGRSPVCLAKGGGTCAYMHRSETNVHYQRVTCSCFQRR